MAQREWVEKDFYKELGVSSDATTEQAAEEVTDVGAAGLACRTEQVTEVDLVAVATEAPEPTEVSVAGVEPAA